MDKIKTLELVSNLAAIPGYEDQVRKFIKSQLSDKVSLIEYDNLGSIITSHNNKSKFDVYISGHMDEIGLLVSYIDEKGFMYVSQMGGWNPYNLFSMDVDVYSTDMKNCYKGCIYSSKLPNNENKITLNDLFVDVGVENKEELALLGIGIGSVIVPSIKFNRMANKKYLISKAFDNRVGIASVIEIMKQLSEHSLNANVFGVGTVQEENGCRGATTSGNKIRPDLAFAIDVSSASDNPVENSIKFNGDLGRGPVIHLLDGGMVANKKLFDYVVHIANINKIPYQIGAAMNGTTDLCKVHLAHDGCPGLYIGIAQRYMHSQVNVIHEDDYLNTIKLMVEVLKNIDDLIIESFTDFEGE